MGEPEWGKVYGGYHLEYASSLAIVDQGYAFAGWSHSFSSNRENDIWALRVDTNGNIPWQKAYGGDGGEGGGHISKTTDGGFILGGYSITFGNPDNGGAGQEDFFVLKLDSEGQICSSCPLIKNTNATPVSVTVTANDGSLERSSTSVIGEVPNLRQYDPSTLVNTLCFKPNTRPVADAGPDQEVIAGTNCAATVGLDGSGSHDEDGDLLTYTWTLNEVTVSHEANPSVSLPLGTHSISLVVNDGNIDSQPDTVQITVVDNTPPTIKTIYHDCVPWGKGKGSTANKIVLAAEDNCSTNVTPLITNVEVFNNGGNLVNGNGIVEISGDKTTVFVKPNGAGWSVKITASAKDGNGNTAIVPITLPLKKC
jgi:hypothetical protein